MIDFRFHMSDLTEKSVLERPECQSSLKIEAARVIVGQCESRIRVCIVANSISRKNPSLEKSPTASKTTLVRDL